MGLVSRSAKCRSLMDAMHRLFEKTWLHSRMLLSDLNVVFSFISLTRASACNGFKDDGVMIAAASSALWNHGRACGKVLHVRCVGATNNGAPHPCRRDGATVTVKIVDFCPPGCRGTIDLSEEAFAEIADPNAGKIKISY